MISDNSLLLSLLNQPSAGRLCYRSLPDGDVVVGVLRLPPDFVPKEGSMYILLTTPGGLAIIPQELDSGAAPRMNAYGIEDLLREAIWAKTISSEARPVRFLQAFPEENTWTVFGPSHHLPAKDAPSHRWVDIKSGVATPIPAPIEGNGMAISQLLTSAPVWPNAEGTLHTLPQLPMEWRAHYYRHAKLLASAARDPDISTTLEKTIAEDRILRQMSYGRVDRSYCLYLARLEDRGLLDLDRPRTAAEDAARRVIDGDLVRTQFTEENGQVYSAPASPPTAEDPSNEILQRPRRPG